MTLTTIFLTTLLLLGIYSTLLPSAQAVELTSTQKGLEISNDVLGFDTNENTTIAQQLPQDSYKDVVPQENILIRFDNDQNKLEMIQTFADGELRKIYVLETKGNPELTDLSYESFQIGDDTFYNNVFNEAKHAKDFLNNYNSYTEKSFYSTLATTFNSVKGDKNETTISGNIKFEATATEDAKTFRWTYINNGVEAPSKCVVFGYENGYLKYFMDNWDLYKIGSTQVNISEKAAIEITLEASENFSWNMGSGDNLVAIKDFTVANALLWETVYCSSLYADEARNQDPLTLYPLRHVWVSLDKFYPGNVYGFNVYVWADTGEICGVNERVYTLDPPVDKIASIDDYSAESVFVNQNQEIKSSSISNSSVVFTALIFGMLSIFPAGFLFTKKKKSKYTFSKFACLVICFSMVSMIIVFPNMNAKADIRRRALIWGSESTGDTSGPSNTTGRKTSDEITQQQSVSTAIDNYFGDIGYANQSWQGAGSIKEYILLNISDAESNYATSAVVNFNHGIGTGNITGLPSDEWHYWFEDQVGPISNVDRNFTDPNNWVNTHMVYDMDIYNNTTEENTFFVFMNTCLSANISTTQKSIDGSITWNSTQGMVSGTNRARSMPFAWTHRTAEDKNGLGGSFDEDYHISDDGYTYADDGDYCYIGFPWGSAALNQTVESGFEIYAEWVKKFFWYALSFDISINNALNEASLDIYNDKFGDTDLATGYSALWPMYVVDEWITVPFEDSTMVVYGNGNIHLYEYYIKEVDSTSTSGIGAVSGANYITGVTADSNYAYLYTDYYWGISGHAVLVGDIGWIGTGDVYLYGKTDSGISSKVQVWVSYNGVTYYQVGTEKTITNTSADWIDFGTYSNEFRYIAISCLSDTSGEASRFSVDFARIIPGPTSTGTTDSYYVETTSEFEDGGTVDNHAYLRGLKTDGDEAHIHCSSSGNMGQIKCNLTDAVSGGFVRIFGHSNTGYTSDLYVYASANFNDWYQIGTTLTLSGSSNSEWIDIGHYHGNFEYVAVVGYHTGNQICLYLDCLRVFLYS